MQLGRRRMQIELGMHDRTRRHACGCRMQHMVVGHAMHCICMVETPTARPAYVRVGSGRGKGRRSLRFETWTQHVVGGRVTTHGTVHPRASLTQKIKGNLLIY